MGAYLVTGAAGFIGNRVTAALLKQGHKVVGIDDLNDAYDPRLKRWRLNNLLGEEGFEFHQIDIIDRASLEGAIGGSEFSAIINMAARAGVRQSVKNPDIYFRCNVLGAMNLLEIATKTNIDKFIQASTSSLYGAQNPRPFKEDADISRPLSPYAASKGAAEMLCYSYHALHSLDITILRYFTVYGPAGRPEMSIFRFIQWITEGRPLVLYGDGEQERDFTFVEDIARGTLAALETSGFQVINLGGDQPLNMREIISKLENIIGKRANIEQHGEAPGDVRATWADITRAQELLGWKPEVAIDDGLRETVAWYQVEREWASMVDTSD